MLLVSYFCALVFMNNSSCLKVCWSDMYKSFMNGDFENSWKTILQKTETDILAWKVDSIGDVIKRPICNRTKKNSPPQQGFDWKSVFTEQKYCSYEAMIILLSGDISLNSGPGMNQDIQTEVGNQQNMGMGNLWRHRGIKAFHQNI